VTTGSNKTPVPMQWTMNIPSQKIVNFICKMILQNTRMLFSNSKYFFLVNIPVPLTIFVHIGLHNWSISMECISLPAAYAEKQNTLPFNATPVHCTDL
jgi:hypothetical protein